MTTTGFGRIPESLRAVDVNSSTDPSAIQGIVRRSMGGVESLAHRLDRGLTRRLGGPARKQIILVLAGVLAMNGANSGAIGAMAAELERSLHIDNTGLGLLVTASSIAGAVLTIPVGILADRFNRRRLLLVGLAVWSAAVAVSAFSGSFAALVIAQLAIGGAAATVGPTVASMTGDLFAADERGRIYGFILTGELIGAGFGIVVVGDIGAVVGWRAALIVLAAAGAGLAVLVFRYLPEPVRRGDPHGARQPDGAGEQGAGGWSDHPSGPPDAPELHLTEQIVRQGFVATTHEGLPSHPERLGIAGAARYILDVRTNVLLILASSIGYFFFAGVRTFAVLFISRRFGLPQAVTTLLVPLVGVGAVIGILTAGRLSDWLIRRGRIDARIIVAAGSYLVAVVLFLPALLTTSLVIGLPLVVLAGAAIGAPNPPLDAARLDVMPSRLWGRAEAVRTALRALLESTAPLLFGFLSMELGGNSASLGAEVDPSGAHEQGRVLSGGHAHGLQLAFLIMLVPLAVSGYLVWRARRDYPGDVLAAAAVDREVEQSVDRAI